MQNIFSKYKLLIPVSIMTILCIGSVLTTVFGYMKINGETYYFRLELKHYITFGIVALNWITFFVLRKYFKYVLTATLILGLINLISFTLSTFRQGLLVGVGGSEIDISFQPVSFLLLLLTYFLCFKRVNEIISKPFKLKPEDAENRKQELQQNEINRFKERYSSYSNESLNTILEEKKYMPEALEAARQILELREKKT